LALPATNAGKGISAIIGAIVFICICCCIIAIVCNNKGGESHVEVHEVHHHDGYDPNVVVINNGVPYGQVGYNDPMYGG
jgi:hypothetical protein